MLQRVTESSKVILLFGKFWRFWILRQSILNCLCVIAVLMAQETDWMDKLEKQLRRSPKMAADAEEISEELDVSWTDVQGFTHLNKLETASVDYLYSTLGQIFIGMCDKAGFIDYR